MIKTSDNCVFSKADLWAIRLRDFLYDGFCLQSKTDKTLKNVNKHFRNFVGQDQQKTKSENGMKSSQVSVVVTRRRFRRMEIKFVNQT